MFTSNVLNNKRFRQMKGARLWKNVILWTISPREISSLVVTFKKKIDQPSWRTTRRNYKHIPQIVCTSTTFPLLHLLSWEFELSEILWWYTIILVCLVCHLNMLKSADLHETILTPVIYLKHVPNHDDVFLREVSIARSKEDEKLIFFTYVSRFPLSEVIAIYLTKSKFGQLSFPCDRN